jgi:hypothetical protein
MARSSFQIPKDAPFDLVSYARRGLERRLSLAQVEQIARTVRRVPEVMVKVSGGGTSVGAVKAHFRYIGREDFTIETDEAEQLTGKDAASKLIENWGLDLDADDAKSAYNGRPGRKPGKLVHNIVLSMPAGTPAEKVLATSRDFARETFAFQHRYALVLHTNEPHPHVHLVVRAMGEHGKRMNIRKATLQEWRREFARHLRSHGVAANATERPMRGETRVHKRDGIYRAHARGASTHMRERVEAAAAEMLEEHVQTEPGKAKLLQTRRDVERGWLAVSEILASQGQRHLASHVQLFLESMPPPETEKERLLAGLRTSIDAARMPNHVI